MTKLEVFPDLYDTKSIIESREEASLLRRSVGQKVGRPARFAVWPHLFNLERRVEGCSVGTGYRRQFVKGADEELTRSAWRGSEAKEESGFTRGASP